MRSHHSDQRKEEGEEQDEEEEEEEATTTGRTVGLETTASPDSLYKTLDFRSCCVRRHLTNVVKQLQQILNHQCVLVNSALKLIIH